MSEIKHTPGPWNVNQPSDAVVVDSGGRDVAITMTGARNIEEDAANARLIAAAPEVLAALIAAKEHLEYCGYGDAWERECAMFHGLSEQIRAAIAKAKGGEE